jgi:hypothetical protein
MRDQTSTQSASARKLETRMPGASPDHRSSDLVSWPGGERASRWRAALSKPVPPFALLIAKLAGARSSPPSSDEKLEQVRSLGVDETIKPGSRLGCEGALRHSSAAPARGLGRLGMAHTCDPLEDKLGPTANTEHVAQLKHFLEEWNEWRQENPDIRPAKTKCCASMSNARGHGFEPDIGRQRRHCA